MPKLESEAPPGQARLFLHIAATELRLLLTSSVPYLALGLVLLYVAAKPAASPPQAAILTYDLARYCIFLIPLCFLFVFLRAARREQASGAAELLAARPVGVPGLMLGKIAAVIAVQCLVLLAAFLISLIVMRPHFSAGGPGGLAASLCAAFGGLAGLTLPGFALFTTAVMGLAYRAKNDLLPLLGGLAVWIVAAFSPGPHWVQYFLPLFMPHRYNTLTGFGSMGAVIFLNRLLALSLGLACLAALILIGPRAWRLLPAAGFSRHGLLGLALLGLCGCAFAAANLARLPAEQVLVEYDAERCLAAAGAGDGPAARPVADGWLLRMLEAPTARPDWAETWVKIGNNPPACRVLAAPADLERMAAFAAVIQSVLPAFNENDQFPQLAAGFRLLEVPYATPEVTGETIVLPSPPPAGRRAAIAVLCRAWWRDRLTRFAPPIGKGGDDRDIIIPGWTALTLLQEWLLAEELLGKKAVGEELEAWQTARQRTPEDGARRQTAHHFLAGSGAAMKAYNLEELDWALRIWAWSRYADRKKLMAALLGLARSPVAPFEYLDVWQAALAEALGLPPLQTGPAGKEAGP